MVVKQEDPASFLENRVMIKQALHTRKNPDGKNERRRNTRFSRPLFEAWTMYMENHKGGGELRCTNKSLSLELGETFHRTWKSAALSHVYFMNYAE